MSMSESDAAGAPATPPEPSSLRLRVRRRRRVAPERLADPSLYLDRELSLIEFQKRVLELAKDVRIPLLERLRFLTIASTNLDEFFEIRVAGLRQQAAVGVAQRGPVARSPKEQLERIGEAAHQFVEEQYRVLNTEVLPALEAEGIRLVRRSDWSARLRRWIRRHFASAVMPVLTPMGLDPAHPFPKVLNKGLNFIVSLEGADAFGRHSGIAVLQVPRSLPRLIVLPRKVATGDHDFAMLSSIIHEHVGDLFPGMKVLGCYQFRVTRNSDLWVDDEEVDNLLQAVKGELPARRFGAAVRLEVADNCPQQVSSFLLDMVELEPKDLYQVSGPVNLHRLIAIFEQVDRPDLKYPPFLPGLPRRLRAQRGLFDVVRRGDVLLHHPFESFAPVVELVREAADDANVLAIKQTLYRTGLESPLVQALVDAARAGKEVTALVELRARFDEAENIDLATRLQEAGANVVYGIVGYKAHAKALLVVRREGRRLRRYVHLGTGNYHLKTAKAYTDFSLLTCDREIGEDVHRLFAQLTGVGRSLRMKRLLQSPFTLHRTLLRFIARETEEARAGRAAHIVAKMNSLTDPSLIQALYDASQAGVEVDLIVRGICCLRPGVQGVSERIRVRSVLGRFLEHTRIFRFHAGGDDLVYCASADWMQRNLYHRVETCFPIEDARLRQRVISEGLDTYLADNTYAWILRPDGTYRRAKPGRHAARNAQSELLRSLAD